MRKPIPPCRVPPILPLTFLTATLLAWPAVLLAADVKVSPTKKLPLPGEVFLVADHTAFLISAKESAPEKSKPWIWYAPTLPPYPGDAEKWMFEQWLAAGIAIAGIDAGESYGSPAGRKLFTRLYLELTQSRGYASRPVLLGRSRGGLQLLNWAADNPDKVAAFAGIYPVCNLASYPGLAKAAPAGSRSRRSEPGPRPR